VGAPDASEDLVRNLWAALLILIGTFVAALALTVRALVRRSH
jgi:hypothetical protein